METQTVTRWAIDPMHSEVQFKVKHLVISTVTVFFRSFQGTAESDRDDFSNARIEFTIDASSVDTNQPQRDGHLRGEEFFDTEKYPHIRFTSTSFRKTGDNEYELAGDLTIKDKTRPVQLRAEYGGSTTDFYGNTKAGFEITGKVNRKEYGLSWNGVTEAGSIVAGDEIKLLINVQLTKQA